MPTLVPWGVAHAEGKPIPSELRREEADLRHEIELEDDNTAVQRTHIDDEYAHAGEQDPKVLITTSRDPSSRLLQFAKELKLVFPNSQRINRGGQVGHRRRCSSQAFARLLANAPSKAKGMPRAKAGTASVSVLQVLPELVGTCRNHDFTDIVVVHEHRGEPDGIVVSHLPYGPTAYFGIFNTVSNASKLWTACMLSCL